MRRVVVTGLGVVSSIGNNAQEVVASLHDAKSGIVGAEDYKKMGFRSQVHGSLKIDVDAGALNQTLRLQRRFDIAENPRQPLGPLALAGRTGDQILADFDA